MFLSAGFAKGQVGIDRPFDLSGAVILTLFKPLIELAFGEVEALGLFDVGNLVALDEAVNGRYGKPQESRGFGNGKESVFRFAGCQDSSKLLPDDDPDCRHQPVIG